MMAGRARSQVWARRARLIGTGAVVALGLLLDPLPAHALQLLGNERGNAIVLFRARDTETRPLELIEKQPGGKFGKAQTLGFDQPYDVRLNSQGTLAASWYSYNPDRLSASFRSPGSDFGPRRTIAEGDQASSGKIAVNGAGESLVSWLT